MYTGFNECKFNSVTGGSGVIYGIDPSRRAWRYVAKRLRKEIKEEKVLIYPVRLPLVPFKMDFFDRIYHTNCYYFWWNMSAACTELHNILQPHGKMVTTLNIDRLKWLKSKGGFHVGDYDPIRYMATLEEVGFQNVHLEYLTDPKDKQFEIYQAIFAEVGDKYAHYQRDPPQHIKMDSSDVHAEQVDETIRIENQAAAKIKKKEHKVQLNRINGLLVQ